ncbi:MAG: hypothetical protein AAGC85_00955 [Bacteroidota bacterium]
MMNVFANMKRTMEILNLLVGFELVAIGILYLIKLDIASAASWSIFGCMYIVMDKYSVLENMSKNRRLVEGMKFGSAWLGFAISTAFLLYVIFTL